MNIDNILWKANKAKDKAYHWCVEHQQWEEEPHEESLEKAAAGAAAGAAALIGRGFVGAGQLAGRALVGGAKIAGKTGAAALGAEAGKNLGDKVVKPPNQSAMHEENNPIENANIEKILPALVGLLMSDKNVKKERNPYERRAGSSFTEEDLAELKTDDPHTKRPDRSAENPKGYPQSPDVVDPSITSTDIIGQQHASTRPKRNPTTGIEQALLKLMKQDDEKKDIMSKPSPYADKYPKNQEPFTPDQMDTYVKNLHAGNPDIPINHYNALNYMANGKYSLAPSMMVGGINARRERPKNKNTGRAVSFGTDPRQASLPFDEHPPMTIHEFHEHFLKATPNTGTYGHLRDSGSTTPENAYYRATHGPTGWHTSVSSNAEAKPTEGIRSMREDTRIAAGNQENLPNAKAYATHWDDINNNIAALSADHNLANAQRGGDDTWQLPKGIENALLKLMKDYKLDNIGGEGTGTELNQKVWASRQAKEDAKGPVIRATKRLPGQIKRVAEATGKGAKDIVSSDNLSRWAGVEQSLLKLMKDGTINMHNTAMPRKRAMENAVGQSTAKAEQTTSEQLETERGRGDDNGTTNALGQSVIQGVEGLIMNRSRYAGSGVGRNGTSTRTTTPESIVEPSEAAEANQNGSGEHWGNTFGSPGGIGGGSSKPVTPKTVPEVYEPEPVGKDMYQPDPENDKELKPIPQVF